ncbi:MAG TPA: biotin/lipoyl-binding protein [Acidimicrobiia bacterium]|nr:biotin/lipoyl-binding protein [Acidimicrobiia bacterium]
MMRTRLIQGVLGFTALALLVGSFKVMQSKPEPPPPTKVTVTRGVVLASVNATGNVTVSDQLALDFPVGGKVVDIYVKEGQRVVAGQPLASIDDAAARARVEQARADLDAAQENVRRLLEGSTPNEQQQNNAAIDAARSGLTKANETVVRAQDTLTTGRAARQNAVNDARRNLDNIRAAAAQHTRDLQQDIDQIQERLDEHTAQLNIHQAKYDFDSAQADSARAAELETLRRIDGLRAILADIEDRMRDKNCNTGAGQQQGGSGGQTTNTTSGTAGTRSNVANPLALNVAGGKTTTTTATTTTAKGKGGGGSGNSKECDRLAEEHAQVELDLRHEEDQLQVIRQDRNRYEGYVRDDAEQLIQDRQTVEQDERDLADARNALRAGQIDDQNRIIAAEQQLTTAVDDQKKGDLADQQAVDAARNDVDTAEAEVAQQVAAKAVQEERPKNQAEVAAAQADVKNKQAVVDDAQRQLDDTTLVAPTDGTVAVIGGRIGEEVPGGGSNRGGFDASALSRPPNAQAPGSVSSRAGGFVTLTDLGTTEVKARFSEADTAKIKPGQAAKVEFESLGQQLTARVIRIDPIETVVANVVTYTVTLLLDKKLEEIKPGMTGNVDVIIAQKQNVLRLPVTAINPRNGRATVQVVKPDGELETRQVSTGLKGDDDIEITSGLDEGDKVVVTPGGGGAGGGQRAAGG